MPFRFTMFFQQRPNLVCGWSTSFWSNAGTIEVLEPIAKELETRIELLQGDECTRVARRYSPYPFVRAAKVQFNSGATANDYAAQTSNADYPTTAILMRMAALPNYRTHVWLRGIPDDCVINGGGFTMPAAITGRFMELRAHLTNAGNQWCLRVQDKSLTPKLIFSVSNAGVVNAPGHGFASGDRVRISRVKGVTAANGLWNVLVDSADQFSLVGWVAPVPAQVYQGGGTVTKQSWIFPQIVGCEFVRTTKHNVGRPFGVFTGRRRTVA